MEIQKQVVGQLKLVENVVTDVEGGETPAVDVDTLSSMASFDYEISAAEYDQIRDFEALEVSFKALFEIGTANGRKNAVLTAFDIYTRTSDASSYVDIQFVATDNVIDSAQITDDSIIGVSETMTIPSTTGTVVHVPFIEPIPMDRTDVCRIYMRNSDGQCITFGAQARKDPFFNAMTTPFGRAKIVSGIAWLPKMKVYIQTQSSQSLQQLIATKTMNEVRERLNYLESL